MAFRKALPLILLCGVMAVGPAAKASLGAEIFYPRDNVQKYTPEVNHLRFRINQIANASPGGVVDSYRDNKLIVVKVAPNNYDIEVNEEGLTIPSNIAENISDEDLIRAFKDFDDAQKVPDVLSMGIMEPEYALSIHMMQKAASKRAAETHDEVAPEDFNWDDYFYEYLNSEEGERDLIVASGQLLRLYEKHSRDESMSILPIIDKKNADFNGVENGTKMVENCAKAFGINFKDPIIRQISRVSQMISMLGRWEVFDAHEEYFLTASKKMQNDFYVEEPYMYDLFKMLELSK